MRELYLGNGDKQFKFADTTTEIHLNAFDGGSAATLTADAKVKIKNDSGYLLGISASITNNHAIITSGQLAKLPVGSYLLELWDTVDGGTAIYPSDGFLALQINENVTGLSGGLVSSIAVDDFVKQFSSLSEQLKQQVSDAVSDGLKGEKGDDGLSAYQVAVINGYQGSQTEWLASLVGAKGDTGEKGNPGKDFRIVKTFPSIAAMNGDGFSDGDFTMIASDVNDPDDGKLYVWNGTSFTYVADLSGSQGIKGDTGEKGDPGEKGKTGEQGLSAYQVAVNAGFSGSVDEWLASLVGAKGDTGDTGPQGVPGPVGAGLTVKGTVKDVSQLPATGNQEGYCYFIGTDLYIWDAGTWKNYGGVIPNLSNYVTDNKDGTISVNGANILPANENVITRIDEAYTDMNDIPMGWFYLNGWAARGLANWGLTPDFYYVHCFKTEYGVHTSIQVAYGTSLNNTYVRTKSDTSWTTWKLLADDSKVLHLSTGDTASRPTGITTGYQYFDTSLNKPVWYTGKNWVDATGTTV